MMFKEGENSKIDNMDATNTSTPGELADAEGLIQVKPVCLMPKRITSTRSRRKNSPPYSGEQKKDRDQEKEEDFILKLTPLAPKPEAKSKKDRSGLVGVKRTRKSRDQIYQLQRCFELSKGKPTKAQLKQLSKTTGLQLQQVYKWYWDIEKKNDKLQKEIKNSDAYAKSPLRIQKKILKTQYTDEFGGYSKTWLKDGIKDLTMGHAISKQASYEDLSMDQIARNLGLDIEKIALQLAMRDDNKPPTQVHTICDEEKIRQTLKRQESAYANVESKNSTPAVPFREIRKGLLQRKSSPIVTPINVKKVPSCYSHASASNTSTVIGSKPPCATKHQPVEVPREPQQQKKEFTSDAINQAFQNLFGNMNSSPQKTPGFYNQEHQIKAQPLGMSDKLRSLEHKKTLNKDKLSSVFSPIPCKPQSQCSIFGKVETPNNHEKPPKASALTLHAQGSSKQRITPGQFLRLAQPVEREVKKMEKRSSFVVADSPNFYNLFNKGLTPTSLRRPAQRSSPKHKPTTVVNLFGAGKTSLYQQMNHENCQSSYSNMASPIRQSNLI